MGMSNKSLCFVCASCLLPEERTAYKVQEGKGTCPRLHTALAISFSSDPLLILTTFYLSPSLMGGGGGGPLSCSRSAYVLGHGFLGEKWVSEKPKLGMEILRLWWTIGCS